ncbi:MAG TPA: hypothetical protein VNE59_05840 [Burkholderiales bacterium]|nr:hypothetical protein [Burkholderiales bacterium]
MTDRVLLTDVLDPTGVGTLARAAEVLEAPDGEPATVRRLARCPPAPALYHSRHG